MDRHLHLERIHFGPGAQPEGVCLSATPPESQLDSLFAAELPTERATVWPLLAVLAGIFLVQVDLFATLVAMPSIQTGLGFDGGALQFLIAGFSIANASLLIASGRLGDLYGSRRIYLIGLVLFTTSSLAAAIAGGLWSLALARTLQGVAAALIQPQVLGILARTYQGDSSRRAFAAYTFTMGLGSVTGQVLGGMAISLDFFGLGWRGVFFAMVPAALTCLVVGRLAIPHRLQTHSSKLDWTGVAFSVALLGLITTPLTIGASTLPRVTNLALLLAAPVVAYMFMVHQRLMHERGLPHMLPMRLLLIRGTQIDLLAVFCFFCGLASFHVLQTLYLQQAQGASALQTGLVFSSMAVGFMIASAAVPALTRRLGRSSIILGVAVLICSHALNMAGAVLGLGLGVLALSIFSAGVGLGFVMGPLISSVLARVPPVDTGVMSGLVATLQAAANAIGVAIVPIPFLAASLRAGTQERVSGYSLSLVILIALAAMVAILTALRRKR